MAIDPRIIRPVVKADVAAQAARSSAVRDSSRNAASMFATALRGIKVTLAVVALVFIAGLILAYKSRPTTSVPSADHSDKPTSTQSASDVPARPSPDQVAQSANESISQVLAIARNGDSSEILQAARQAGRTFDFSPYHPQLKWKLARKLDKKALSAFYEGSDPKSAYGIQLKAFDADPLDTEIAGNLAIYAFRTGRTAEARMYVLYALSLPRPLRRSGRTADWATLAAIDAAAGDAADARAALYVTLAIAPDVKVRCKSAKDSVNNIYGPVLRDATEAMFERIRDQSLSEDEECATPIQW
ncbi:hypothetical protein [Paraburkholderia sp. MM6662-R1]|uniref:hypothetical protein n=1 Tax=Paraburkholderia sp. MM6662-R1 TaxID=2991066 RepID=UPI003D1E25A3